jgi:carbon catabolite-derepressing protein kinase
MSQAGSANRPYVSKVGILPSSIPTYHKDYNERQKAGVSQSGTSATNIDEEPPPARTDAEKEESARRLKPHSRSQLRLDESSKRPQGMTPVAAKKPKPVRWQFGIRSRNAPWEALLTIHKALHKLGATYQPDEDFELMHAKDGDESRSGESSFVDERDGGSLGRGSTGSMDPSKGYRLPADPWHIRVRWDSSSKYSRLATVLLVFPLRWALLTVSQPFKSMLQAHPCPRRRTNTGRPTAITFTRPKMQTRSHCL